MTFIQALESLFVQTKILKYFSNILKMGGSKGIQLEARWTQIELLFYGHDDEIK